jgi:hypothetical protein
MKQQPTQHSRRGNDLLEAAKAATEWDKRPRKPKTLSLFDVPAVAKACMTTLRMRGIGLVQVQMLVALPGKPAEITVRYFAALDRIGDAEPVGSGMSSMGRYTDYALPVGDMAVIRWRKLEAN